MRMVRTNPAYYYTVTSDGQILYKREFYDLDKADQDFVTSNAEKDMENQLKKNSDEAEKKSNSTKDTKLSSPWVFNGLYGSNPFSLNIPNSSLNIQYRRR
jgi:hypothetical protein